MTFDSIPSARGKRARTRDALVAATLQVVAEKGFAAASLDAIAAHAGMTKGAIYSNFSGKAGLLLAAMSAKGLTLSRPARTPRTLDEALDDLADSLMQTLGSAAKAQVFIAEFQLYAAGDPDMRAGLAEVYVQGFGHSAESLARLTGMGGGVDPRRLAVALQSIALGFMIQSLITPDEVTREVVRDTLAALGAGLATDRTG